MTEEEYSIKKRKKLFVDDGTLLPEEEIEEITPCERWNWAGAQQGEMCFADDKLIFWTFYDNPIVIKYSDIAEINLFNIRLIFPAGIAITVNVSDLKPLTYKFAFHKRSKWYQKIKNKLKEYSND